MNFEKDFPNIITQFQNKQVLVIGDVMLDRYCEGDVERISPEAPIPILSNYNLNEMPGGAANVAVNLSSVGIKVSLVGSIGTDQYGKDLNNILKKTSLVDFFPLILNNRKTTTKTRFYSKGKQLLRLDYEDQSPIDLIKLNKILKQIEKLIKNSNALILSDYDKGLLTKKFISKVIHFANKNNIPIIVDPKKEDFSNYAYADIITPNLSELEKVSKKRFLNNNQIANYSRRILKNTKIKNMLVTLGKDGMLLINQKETFFLNAKPTEVSDVSGAGDTVVALLTSVITSQNDFKKASYLANLAGGISVSKKGTAKVSIGEILAILKLNLKKTSKNDLERSIEKWRIDSEIIGFANGCFDILHPGHLHLLKKSKEKCSKLIVGINSDKSVRLIKGKDRPFQSEVIRYNILNSLPYVDEVIIFDEKTPLKIIKNIKPNLIFKGSDYKKNDVVGFNFLKKYGGKIIIIPLLERFSTSNNL